MDITLRRFAKFGSVAACICGLTYVFGFVLLVTVMAPLGFGTGEINTAAVVDFIVARPGVMLTWNLTIYVLNALALAVLAVCLGRLTEELDAVLGRLVTGLGLMWAALVLGAGMVANVAVETVLDLAATDVAEAAQAWTELLRVELGLGGGNEIAGGVWIALSALPALRRTGADRLWAAFGLLVGLSGLATILPPLGDVAGAVFGLGGIVWFLWTGVRLSLVARKG